MLKIGVTHKLHRPECSRVRYLHELCLALGAGVRRRVSGGPRYCSAVAGAWARTATGAAESSAHPLLWPAAARCEGSCYCFQLPKLHHTVMTLMAS